jgi:hypothetical protein
VSKKVIKIGEEVFDFLAWKVVRHSLYLRRSDGELRVLVFVGSGLPLWATRFHFEFGDGITIPFESYELLPLSLSEISQLQSVLQESRENKAGKPAVAKELSAKRSKAGKRKARIQDPGDIRKIKKAFAVRTTSGLSDNAAAQQLAELVSEDPKALDLRDGPYYNTSSDAIRRLVGVKKN